MVQDPNQSSFGLTPNVEQGWPRLHGARRACHSAREALQQWVRFVAVQSIVLAWRGLASRSRYRSCASSLCSFRASAIRCRCSSASSTCCAPSVFRHVADQTIKAFQGGAQRFPIVSDWTDRFMPAAVNLTSSFTPPRRTMRPRRGSRTPPRRRAGAALRCRTPAAGATPPTPADPPDSPTRSRGDARVCARSQGVHLQDSEAVQASAGFGQSRLRRG